MRQPYGKVLASTVTQAHPVWYARQGFIVVIQDVRGRGESEGEFAPFVHEADDGYDAVEWSARLPGSNGRVGMYGFSYQGCTQWAAASKAPPSLKAIAPGMCGANVYSGMIYPQGRFAAAEHVPWAFQLARDAARRAGDAETEALCTRIRMQTPDELLYPLMEDGTHPILENYFPAYREWLEHPSYDDYWEKRNWMEGFKRHPIPAFLIGGWYDVFLMGTLTDYESISDLKRSNELRFKLTVGPWDHIPWGRFSGGHDHGSEADGNIHAEQVAWFRYWLDPDSRRAELPDCEVTCYERGSKQWVEMECVSPLSAKGSLEKMWLGNNGKAANGVSGGGSLRRQASGTTQEEPDIFVYDARLPMRLDGFQPIDRRMAQDRYEILVYTSAPLQRDMSVLGALALKLQVQAMGSPTDIAAIASIVSLDGSVTFLTAGIAEITSVADECGQCEMLGIEMRPVSVLLRAGESLRLELSGSAYPLFEKHHNSCSLEEKRRVGAGELQMAAAAIHYEHSILELPVRVKEEERACIVLEMAETTGM
jgi:hypothetical protein